MDDSICAPVAHVSDTVSSTIRPDRWWAVDANLQPLWLLTGGLLAIVSCLYLSQRLFPQDIGVSAPTVKFEPDRFVVTSQIINHTARPVTLTLRFKIVAANAGIRGQIRGRPFAVKDNTVIIPGTASTTAKCEFPRTAFLPLVPAAEVQILSRQLANQ